ncbi:uncharacterized protein TRIADDRAFT_25963 [Trichoplax adhaerens]|uniref:E3 ubiquitin-protein ligase listerin n=1 Tax=Trichoplax adhaerens TaxID=10228 RepID=B3RYB2_TRIAD|nr:hypothetical protein TRIADDRAFT_25963 [Trichoplax adhaerens]EDV25006.1 hypothetical protein TRIADDRAFT_25963 [Trichoplax adhaerens]|eukprot:XP_002112896.1 hypothetical protein TRIADDRAFT_25963 [Trichoplax adhaerens]
MSLAVFQALQELAELCLDKPIEEIIGLLHSWTRSYNRLAYDVDRKVREATQQALLSIVKCVRRRLAPHLKSIIGCWLCSHHDSYAPAATAAKVAFDTAFPPLKRAEVMKFCLEETITHIKENLFVHTPATLSNTGNISTDDMESKYQRVVASSLLALGQVINTLAPNDIEDFDTAPFSEILDTAKFWKLGKSDSPMIRSAFFTLMAIYYQHLPSTSSNSNSKACPLILGSIDDTEPLVCRSLWDAILLVVTQVQDCWDHVSARKSVLPKLWQLLRSNGNGSASVIFPALLPFLSKIPIEVSDRFFRLLQTQCYIVNSLA